MTHHWATRRTCVRLFVLALALQTTGCWEWRPSTLSPARLISQEAPDRIRVTVHDGTRVVVYDPLLVGDSIQGRAMDETARFALVELERLETRELSAVKTIGVVVVAGIVGYALVTACFGLVSPC